MLHVVSGTGQLSGSDDSIALVLLSTRLPHSVVMQTVPKGEEDRFTFVTLVVLPKGESGIETDSRSVEIDRHWGGVKTSATIDILGESRRLVWGG